MAGPHLVHYPPLSYNYPTYHKVFMALSYHSIPFDYNGISLAVAEHLGNSQYNNNNIIY